MGDSHQSTPQNNSFHVSLHVIRYQRIMSSYVHFNQEHKILICKVHQYAVSFKFLARHFLEEHDLDIKIRQEIVNYASQFTTVEPTQLSYSLEKVTLVPYLSIITGFQCQYETCNKILGTLNSTQKHCKLDHNWKAKDGSQWIETPAQTFFQGNNKRYGNYGEVRLIW
jgi:hypothetical protein